MASRTVWFFVAVLACAMPASASSFSSLCDQAPGQKPDQPARGTDGKAQDANKNDGRGGKDERRMPWWKAPETRAQLGITDKQSKDIDDIFQATFPSLRAAKDDLDKQDDAVAKLIKDGTADAAVVAKQVEKAEQARAALTTQRTVMLYKMHRLLTPEQRVKLDAMFAQREAERRKNDPNSRR